MQSAHRSWRQTDAEEDILKGKMPDDTQSHRMQSKTSFLMEFFEDTTLHGARFLAKTSLIRRGVWAVILFTASVACLLSIIIAFVDYCNFPVQTKVSVEYRSSLQFPAVTICNVNRYMKSKLGNNQTLMALLTLNANPVFEKDYNISNQLLSSVSNSTSSEEMLSIAGYDVEDMFWDCFWKTHKVNCTEELTPIVTDLGRCFTFNSNGTLKAEMTGSFSGLWLRMRVRHEEYTPGYFLSAGIKMLLHSPHEHPLVNEQGFAMSAGLETLAPIRMTQIKGQPLPYDGIDCIDTESTQYQNPLKFYEYYSLSGCLYECEARFVNDTCGCTFSYHPGTYRRCTFTDAYLCTNHALDLFAGNSQLENQCDCKPPCSQTLYATRLSHLSYPNEPLFRQQSHYNMSEEYLRKEYMELRIFFEQMNYDVVEQSPKYYFSQLIAEVGGLMGIFVGSSFLTICEIGEFLLLLLSRSCRCALGKGRSPRSN